MPATPQDRRKKAPTTAKAWKGKASKPVAVELPSGNTALIKRMPINKMLTSGVLPDSMRPIINDAIADSGKGGDKSEAPDFDVSEIMKDESALNDMFASFDRVLVAVCVEPKVVLPPENESEREDETLYADDVDLEDKIFIFQYAVGGEEDLSEFRKES